MAYPDDIIESPDFIDKGVQIASATYSLTPPAVGESYAYCTLNYRARGRVTTTDGTVYASSIAVSRGGAVFTEVFTLPVPSGNYFFHLEDIPNEQSILYFNATQSDDVTVAYETRGSIIKAETINAIQTDLRTIEQTLPSGIKYMKSGGGITIPSGASITTDYTGTEYAMFLVSAANGAAVSYSRSSSAPITFDITYSGGDTIISYLIIVA